MSLGLRLRAKLPAPCPDPETLLNRIAQWLRETYPQLSPKIRLGEMDECPTVFCKLHPAAEDFEISLLDAEHLVVSANTTTVGPGYHIFLTSLFKNCAANFDFSWEIPGDSEDDFGDETEFFFSGDEKRLREEMTQWLKALANLFFDGTFGPDDKNIALCMPMNPQFDAGQAAITQIGPRDRDWLRKTAESGTNGTDFFAWWDSGMNAGYYLGRALAQMWSDVRWRPPANDTEKAVLADVAGSLQSAYRLNPTLPYPWTEWLEILDLLESGDEEKSWLIPRATRPSTIGYRRKNVWAALPGQWTINVPGSFSDFESDEDGAVCAFDPPREIWFTAYQSQAPLSPSAWATEKQEIRAADPEFLIDRGSSISQASISRKGSDAEEAYSILQASVVCPDKRCICTIVFPGESEQDWALDTWKSLRPPTVE